MGLLVIKLAWTSGSNRENVRLGLEGVLGWVPSRSWVSLKVGIVVGFVIPALVAAAGQ